MQEKEGVVVAVCKSAVRAYPKFPQDSAYICDLGIDGDAHAGIYRRSYSNPLVFKPNDREISIVADEVRLDINKTLNLDIQPGGFNENILVSGVGELGDIPDHYRMSFSSGVELVITEQNNGCYKLNEFHMTTSLVKATMKEIEPSKFQNRRGLVAIVTKTGYLSPGDTFILHNRKFPIISV